MKENSHYGAKILFWEKHHYGALAISNQHQCDVLPKQNVKIYGRNVTMVLTFFFFEPQRGSRGLPLAFLDCLVYSFHFRFSGVATYKPPSGLFFWSKKTLTAHISKSFLSQLWLFSRTLQYCWVVLGTQLFFWKRSVMRKNHFCVMGFFLSKKQACFGWL